MFGKPALVRQTYAAGPDRPSPIQDGTTIPENDFPPKPCTLHVRALWNEAIGLDKHEKRTRGDLSVHVGPQAIKKMTGLARLTWTFHEKFYNEKARGLHAQTPLHVLFGAFSVFGPISPNSSNAIIGPSRFLWMTQLAKSPRSLVPFHVPISSK